MEDYNITIKKLKKLKKVGDNTTIVIRVIKKEGKIIWLRDDITLIKLDNINEFINLSNFINIYQQQINKE